MFRLGLTGGIGSGKTTVASMLEQAGAGVVDADAISRQMTGADGQAINSIREIFGSEFITPDNALDRNKMRALVFSDAQWRKRLENIVHPLVHQKSRLQSEKMSDAGTHCVVFDIPLLVESSYWRQNLDRILVVDCEPEVQIQRVSKRSHLSTYAAEQIVHAQADRSARLKAADIVIFNIDLTLDELTLEVEKIHPYCGL